MEVGYLGPLEVRVAGRPVPVPGQRLRGLLLQLAPDPGGWVPPGSLAEAGAVPLDAQPEHRPAVARAGTRRLDPFPRRPEPSVTGDLAPGRSSVRGRRAEVRRARARRTTRT